MLGIVPAINRALRLLIQGLAQFFESAPREQNCLTSPLCFELTGTCSARAGRRQGDAQPES